jgi:hypothetical protein
MPSPPNETKAERMARIFGEENRAARRQKKKEEEALKNAEAKKAKRAAKVAREATIPCKACGKVQADCYCNGWHQSPQDKARKQQAGDMPQEPRVRLTPEQRERLKHLRVLGLTLSQDTEAEIKRAYRALALLNHPDKQGDPERMKAINASHDFLVET